MGSLLSPAFSLKDRLVLMVKKSLGLVDPISFHFLQERNIKKTQFLLEGKIPSLINLFDTTVILNKLRDLIISDLVLLRLAVSNGPSATGQWHSFPQPGHPRLIPNTCAERKAPEPRSYSSVMWHWIFSYVFQTYLLHRNWGRILYKQETPNFPRACKHRGVEATLVRI